MDCDSDSTQIRLVQYRQGASASHNELEQDPGNLSSERCWKRSSKRGYSKLMESSGAASDTELRVRGDKAVEQAYLSDRLEESLPSYRAKLATNMCYRVARARDDQKESTPLLLMDSGLHDTDSHHTPSEQEDDGYDTMGHTPIKNSRGAKLMTW